MHAGFPEVRPSYGALLVPLFEEDGLRMGELARRSRLAKQTLTTLVRLMERNRLVRRERDPADRRAFRVYLTDRAKEFQPVAERAVAELERRARVALGADGFVATTAALELLLDL